METDGRYMMRNNYRYSVALLDWCQDNDVPFLYASSASVYGGGSVLPRGARVRGAAQRLRLLEVPVRPVRAAACCRSAPRRSRASATSTSTARASSTRGGWRRSRWHFFNQYRARGPRAAVRGSRRLRRRRAAPRFRRRSRTWSSVNLDFLDHPGAQRHLQSRHRQRGDVQRGRRATINACASARRRSRRSRCRSSSPTARSPTSRSRRARRQVPELHRRPISRGCAPPATARRCIAVDEGVAALRRTADFGSRILRVAWSTCGAAVAHGARRPVAAQSTNSRRRYSCNDCYWRSRLALCLDARCVRRDQSSTRRPRTSSSRCRASGPRRRRRSSTTATRTAPFKIGRGAEGRQGHRREALRKAQGRARRVGRRSRAEGLGTSAPARRRAVAAALGEARR